MSSTKNFLIENFQALGTVWYIECFENIEDYRKLEIKHYLEKYILDFQNKYSRFLHDSILNKYNRGEVELDCDEDLKNMIEMGEQFKIETDGIFDINIKDRLEEMGYGKLEKNNIRNIDLGGIGKGYLIDKIKNILEEKFNLKYFLINGGGDIYLTSDNDKEVELYLQHPVEENKFIGSIKIKDRAFCCSSSFKRSWIQNGVEQNHFISDRPVIAASYVVGDNATEADVYATVLCILSDDKEKLERIMKNKNIKNKKLEYLVFDKNADKIVSDNFIYE